MIGAGAAGTFAALAARGCLDAKGGFHPPSPSAPPVILLDGQARPGRKILISGGGRCNVTNVRVAERDYDTDAPATVRGLLAGFPPSSVRAFFEGRGVPLGEEPVGKLFPRSAKARDVWDALLAALDAAGVERRFGVAAAEVAPEGEGWRVGDLRARRVVLATGGRSVPATGSTGFGYALAAALGHAVVEPVPALAGLRGATPAGFPGITLPAILTVEEPDGRVRRRAAGSLLFTHRGTSGPAALDASLAVARLRAEGRPFRVVADFWTLSDPAGPWAAFLPLPKAPGSCLPESPPAATPRTVEDHLLAAARSRPRALLGAVLAERLPRRLVEASVPACGTPLGVLPREARRAAAEAATRFDLGVVGTDGFDRAEVTAGGIPLRELDRRTLESRRAPGLHACGEVCHATGRLGGFNFQWAWSSGFAAGRGAGA